MEANIQLHNSKLQHSHKKINQNYTIKMLQTK